MGEEVGVFPGPPIFFEKFDLIEFFKKMVLLNTAPSFLAATFQTLIFLELANARTQCNWKVITFDPVLSRMQCGNKILMCFCLSRLRS
jgi:hypothetical protein